MINALPLYFNMFFHAAFLYRFHFIDNMKNDKPRKVL